MEPVESYAEECPHAETVYVFRVIQGGSKQYGNQCLRCGRFCCLKQTKIPLHVKLVEYDPSIAEYYYERRRRFFERRFQSEREAKDREWWDRYNEYLETDTWRDKRQRVLERDNWTCQACLRRNATEVHHLTYTHVGDEPLFDLIAICAPCHRKLTEVDRCNRS